MKIVLSAVLALLLVGCGQDTSKATQEEEPAPKETKTEVSEVVQNTVVEMKKDIEIASGELQEKANVAVKKVAETAKVVAAETVDEVSKISKEIVKEVETKADEIKTEVVNSMSSNGSTIYAACAGCHGTNGEKVALGKSKIIKGWSADKIESALNGYKDGSYGGTMKAIMKGQAVKLSIEDTKAVSQYISTLK